MINEQTVMEALKSVQDPELKKSLVELGMIKDITVEEGDIKLTLALTTLRCPLKDRMVDEIKKRLEVLPDVSSVDVQLSTLSPEELRRLFPKHPLVGIEKVRQTLAVASGKGGVGKTTIAVNVALALAEQGQKVGLLDADVYGPSVPVMLGLSGHPEIEHGMLVPMQKFGIKIMSFGMLLEQGQPVIWRGPIVSRAIKQFLGEVMWGELDYLVVDLPPGTGDPSITIAQAIPQLRILMVTTPQEVALADVRRAVKLFSKQNRRILGLIENMSYFQCVHSKEPIEVFGHGGGKKLSEETGLPLLGAIPIDLEISRGGDTGVPLMVSSPSSETAHIFQDIAEGIVKASGSDS
jgi:ATP-binding protein involved in chromosome partitioning